MSRDERKLQRHFEERSLSIEEKKARKNTARLRKAARPNPPARQKAWSPCGLDGLDGLEGHDLHDWDEPVERPRPAWAGAAERQASRARDRGSQPAQATERQGTVAGIGPGTCRVWLDDLAASEVVASFSSDQPARRRLDIAVGDAVAVADRGGGQWRVARVLPRRTVLSRRDPGNPHGAHLLAANVDRVAIVIGVQAAVQAGVQPAGGQLKTGLVDRVLLAVSQAGAEPVLVVTKSDLAGAAECWDALIPYRELGVPIFIVSARTGSGVLALADALRDHTVVLVGQSGVGKSSLANALVPGLRLATNQVRAADGKGRHTTTATSLYELPGGGRLLDTPGIRQFGLRGVSPAEILTHFAEFAPIACRFSGCTHIHEPECGVRAAVAAGVLSESRYRSYVRIVSGL